jgi:hypothetical protein
LEGVTKEEEVLSGNSNFSNRHINAVIKELGRCYKRRRRRRRRRITKEEEEEEEEEELGRDVHWGILMKLQN